VAEGNTARVPWATDEGANSRLPNKAGRDLQDLPATAAGAFCMVKRAKGSRKNGSHGKEGGERGEKEQLFFAGEKGGEKGFSGRTERERESESVGK